MDLQSMMNMGILGSLTGGGGMGGGLMSGLGGGLAGGLGSGAATAVPSLQESNKQPFAQNPGDSMYRALFSPMMQGLVQR